MQRSLSIAAVACLALAPLVGCTKSRTEPVSQQTASLDFYTVDHYDAARSAADDLAMTIERAGQEHKHILVQVGGDWCGWCRRMSEFINTNPRVRDAVANHFLLMKVTYDDKQKNEPFLSAYPRVNAYPHLFVLDSTGKLLHSQDTAVLEEGKGYNEQAYLEFLDKWKPPTEALPQKDEA